MENVRRGNRRSATGCLARFAVGALLGVAPLVGCTGTHTIPPDQLPVALDPAREPNRRVVVEGRGGQPLELPSRSHLRWVQIETRSAVGAQEFPAPVTANLTPGSLRVDGKGVSRTYDVSAITTTRLGYGGHDGDVRIGSILLATGLTLLAAAAAITIYDVTTYEERISCGGESLDICLEAPWIAAGFGAPIGTIGLGLSIPGAILLGRGLLWPELPAKGKGAWWSVPQVTVGPHSAAVAVPF